jgi:hypothetical protein
LFFQGLTFSPGVILTSPLRKSPQITRAARRLFISLLAQILRRHPSLICDDQSVL